MAADPCTHRAVKRREGLYFVDLSLQLQAQELTLPFPPVAAFFSPWGLSSLQTVDGGDGTHRRIY